MGRLAVKSEPVLAVILLVKRTASPNSFPSASSQIAYTELVNGFFVLPPPKFAVTVMLIGIHSLKSLRLLSEE